MSNKVQKMASVDAQRYMAAEMFFGEGAGTRRKLVTADVAWRTERMDGYHEAFQKAYDALDKSKFAEMAVKERKRLDRVAKASRNFKAMKSGNLRGLSTGLYIAVGTAVVLNQTGYDKVVAERAKRFYNDLVTAREARLAREQQFNR